jgi:Tfp pilus assembly protein PilE
MQSDMRKLNLFASDQALLSGCVKRVCTEPKNERTHLLRRKSHVNTGEAAFTLIELMVIIIIIGILVAVSLAVYSHHTVNRELTEAISVIGAIVASEKLEMQGLPYKGFYSASTHADFLAKGLDLLDTKYFTYQATTNEGSPASNFTITAAATRSFKSNPEGCKLIYTYNPDINPAGKWSCDGACITSDMIQAA